MKSNKTLLLAGIISCGLITIIALLPFNNEIERSADTGDLKTSGAGQALDMWFAERAYPNENIPTQKYLDAYHLKKLAADEAKSQVRGSGWESLGPVNIGGRTLCLAFHPTEEDIIYAGSASGGLWKSTSQGAGQNGWEYVPTGFPVLGVGAIAIDQTNPDIIFIGTGETYGVGAAEPGTINRYTRGTYGIGILKSIDGGSSWSQVLAFNDNELKGVQDIEISAQNSNEIYAATTDGLYQSLNGGINWSLIFNSPNCIDVEVDPNDGNIIYVSQGNFNYGLDPSLNGIFKSTNKGVNFTELLDPGLLAAWSGSAKLAFDPTDSNTLYASIQVGWFNTGPTTPGGIFKTTNGGTNWSYINNQNIAQFQGWYSHDIAINPLNTSEIINVGVQTWKSVDSGMSFIQQSNNSWTIGEVPVTIPEGTDAYVHSDIHAVYYHPLNNKIFYATDGGVFVSDNGESPFTTLNGGLQTTQFYADMGSASTSLDLCIAGAQDNATYIYRGTPSWWRVIGGDGMSALVGRYNSDLLYASSQGLNILKSTNSGLNFVNKSPVLLAGDYTAFSAPYELNEANNNILYAGATYLYKSEDAAETWNPTTAQPVDGGNVILKIALSRTDPDILYIATAPDPFGNFGTTPKVLKSTDGGANFTVMNGLPNRVCKDIEIDPVDPSRVYLTFSGFGTDHVFKSTNGGANWIAIDNGLPDLPTNTIIIDPLNSDDLYVGNDLGVYFSDNGGSSWTLYSEGLPEATMVYDLNLVGIPNRKLRIATHGHGIYQRNFVNDPLAVNEFDLDLNIKLYPNPASDIVFIANGSGPISKVTVYGLNGQRLIETHETDRLDISGLSAGLYLVEITVKENLRLTKKLIVND